MAKLPALQASFVGGEFDPTLIGRKDIGQYKNGAEILRNVYVRPQGGAFRREGLAYFASVNDNNEGRIIPFQFNEVQTYILVFTSGRFDVYRTDVVGVVQASVTSSPISAITLTQIKEMTWTQSADTLILAHPDLQPIEISRTSDTTWTAANITFANIPPHPFSGVTVSSPAGTITADVATGIVTVTASGTPFIAAHVGQFINTPKGGRIYITAYTSASVVTGIIQVELESTTAISGWELEIGYEPVISASRGWPRCSTFHKSRLVLGGFKSRPNSVIFSKVGNFFDLDLGEGMADEAIYITLDDEKVNTIRHMFSGRGLNIFTSGGEFSVRSEVDSPLSPESVYSQLRRETSHGSMQCRPVSIDGTVVFVEGSNPTDQTQGRIVRQFIFNDTEQSFQAPSISIFSQHLILNPIKIDIRRSTESNPSNYAYVVNSDGTCAVLNSLREQELLAWSLFQTDGELEDIGVSGNIAFFIVKRNIDGLDVRFIEYLNSDNFMDASLLQTSGTAKTSWTGLDHLDGEVCTVRGDGFILEDATPDSGAITSSESVSELEIGLPFYARVKPLPLQVDVTNIQMAGEYKSPVSVNIHLHQSRNITLKHENKVYKKPFRRFGDDVFGAPVQLFSGWKKFYLGGIRRDANIEITQDEPLEMNILSIRYEVRI